MKKLLLGSLLLLSILGFSQFKKNTNKFGLHIGFGSLDISNDYYNDNKFSFDCGGLYITKSNIMLSLDGIFASADYYDNTGTNGSNSTFEKYDSDTFLLDAKVGYLIKNKIGVMLGASVGSINIYEVKRGYSNLTAYDIDKKNITSLSTGIIVSLNKYLYLGINKSFGENSYTHGMIGYSF